MADDYRVLHYACDVAELGRPVEVPRYDDGPTRRVPVLLGRDAFGRPYEVLDVVVELDRNGAGPYSTVHLGPADVATQRGNRARYLRQQADAAAQRAQEARVRHYWRPDLYAPPEPLDVDVEALRALEAAKAAAA